MSGIEGAVRAAKVYVSVHALADAGRVPRNELRQLVDSTSGVRVHLADGVEGGLVTSRGASRVLAQRLDGTRATEIVDRLSTTRGAAFIKDASGFRPIAGALDAIEGAATISTAPAGSRLARLLPSGPMRTTIAVAAAATGLGTGALVLANRLATTPDVAKSDEPAAPDAPADFAEVALTAPATAAQSARSLIGTVDTAPDGSLDPRVAEMMEVAGIVEPTVHRDWSSDFVAWAFAEASLPLGPGGEGVIDADDLANWASTRGALRDGAPAWDPDAPDASIGSIVLLPREGAAGEFDPGIVIAADADTIEIAQGNRATAGRVGDSAVGAVRHVVLQRDDPLAPIAHTVDPVAARKGELEAMAKSDGERAAGTGPAPSRAPAPAPSASASADPAPAPADPDTGKPIKGVAPPDVDPVAPDKQDIIEFSDWAAAQYATDGEHQQKVAQIMRYVMAFESGFKVHALNLWDRAAYDMKTPSYGLFQYLRPTFNEFSQRAVAANPDAWASLGEPRQPDWRHQVLTSAWALAQPPTDFSRANNGWRGQHGQYWSRWYAIKDNQDTHPPLTSDIWRSKLDAADINTPVEQATVYPRSWRENGTKLGAGELRQIVETGVIERDMPRS